MRINKYTVCIYIQYIYIYTQYIYYITVQYCIYIERDTYICVCVCVGVTIYIYLHLHNTYTEHLQSQNSNNLGPQKLAFKWGSVPGPNFRLEFGADFIGSVHFFFIPGNQSQIIRWLFSGGNPEYKPDIWIFRYMKHPKSI